MSLAYRISTFNRERKYQAFLRLFAPRPEETILDVGFNDQEYGPSDNYLEKKYPYPEKITAIGLQDKERSGEEFSRRYPGVTVKTYRGGRLPFADKEFDIVWSNAVLEHVGCREKQLEFLKEISRVGKRAFLTTPNRNFPIEVHTRTVLLHFLPTRIFHSYLRLIGKGWATGDYMNLLKRRELSRLLEESGIVKYRIIANRLFGFALDFIIIF